MKGHFLYLIGGATLVAVSAFTMPARLAAVAAVQQNQPITLPDTFPLAWMRGLVLTDDATGARVVTGNEKVKVGTVFTKVDGQQVTSVSDLLAKIRAADITKVSITTAIVSQSNAPFYVDHWAEELRLSDTPHGVFIKYSAYPDEAGKFLAGINDVPISSARQAHDLLLRLVQDPSNYRSRTVRGPIAAELASLPAVEGKDADPVRSEVRGRWGALASLPGKSWFCIGYNPGQWLLRRHSAAPGSTSAAVSRMTTAQWLDDRTMQVITQQGNDRWSDRIELQPDRSFRLVTTGFGDSTPLLGQKLPNGEIVFPLGQTMFRKQKQFHSLIFGGSSSNPTMTLGLGFSPNEWSIMSTTCQMDEYTDLRAPRMARNLEQARQESLERMGAERDTLERQAQREAEGAAMLAGMRASAMEEFAKIPRVAADLQAQRKSVEALRPTVAATPTGETSDPTRQAPSVPSAVAAARPVVRQSPPPTMAGGSRSTSPSNPRMCTTPGGTRTWSTGMMTPLADARAEYEEEARNIQSRGGSAGPMQCGKGVTAFGVTSAVCTATLSYPAKSTPCGARVSPQ